MPAEKVHQQGRQTLPRTSGFRLDGAGTGRGRGRGRKGVSFGQRSWMKEDTSSVLGYHSVSQGLRGYQGSYESNDTP